MRFLNDSPAFAAEADSKKPPRNRRLRDAFSALAARTLAKGRALYLFILGRMSSAACGVSATEHHHVFDILGDVDRERLPDEGYLLLKEWTKHLRLEDVLSLGVMDLMCSHEMPDGTRRIYRFPTTIIPYALLRRTENFSRHLMACVDLKDPLEHVLREDAGNPITVEMFRRKMRR